MIPYAMPWEQSHSLQFAAALSSQLLAFQNVTPNSGISIDVYQIGEDLHLYVTIANQGNILIQQEEAA
jgi:hypothetical protein